MQFASRPESLRLVATALGVGAMLVVVACDNRPSAVRCASPCSAVQQCCATASGNQCVDIFSNPAHCGGCGMACAAGQLCVNRTCMNVSGLPDAGPVDARVVGADAPITGMCSPACGADFMCCGTTCVRRDGGSSAMDPSFSNCGACGRACNTMTANRCGRFGSSTVCMCGDGPACDAARGESCVLGTSGNYECLRNDIPENCGSPPVRCNPGESCERGMCVCGSLGRRCPDGETCVSSGGTTSCRDLRTDPLNCGMVGNACAPGEMCVGGSCICPGSGRACMRAGGGMFGGGGPPSCGSTGGLSLPCGMFASCGEVCCATGCVPVSNSNCGACGVSCGEGEDCGTSLFGGGDGGGMSGLDGGFPFP